MRPIWRHLPTYQLSTNYVKNVKQILPILWSSETKYIFKIIVQTILQSYELINPI